MAALDSSTLKQKYGDLRKNFTTSQLVTSGLLLVIGVVGLLFFVQWATAPSYQVFMSGVDAKDAAAITAKLQADGVSYQLQNGGGTILVPASSINQERVAVAAAGLPKNGTTGWDTFDKQGITSSSFQQQVAYQRALEGQIASTLEQLDGVQSADVNLVMPQDQLFTDSQQPARASVMLTMSGTPSDETVQSVIHLVASAVPNLDPKDVTVTDNNGDLLSDQTGSSSDRAVHQTQAYEDSLAAQANSMLDQLLGPGHAVVRVNATMNTSTQTIDSETYDPKHVVTLGKSTDKETYSGAPANSVSGVVSSGPTTGTTGGTGSAGSYKKQSETDQYAASRTVSHTETGPGNVQRLTVSVAVDSNAKNAPATAQLQQLIANAVGLNPSRGDTITVTKSAFPIVTTKPAAQKSSPLTALTGSGMTKTLSSVVAVIVLLLVGLGFLRTLKKGSVESIPMEEVAALQASLDRGALPAGGKKKKGKNKELPAAPSGPAAVRPAPDPAALDALDPDALASVLRGWLASTGSEK